MSHLIRFLWGCSPKKKRSERRNVSLWHFVHHTSISKNQHKNKLSITDTLYWLGQWFKQVFSNRLKESWLESSDQMIFQSDFKLRYSLWIGEVTALIISQEMDFTNIAKHSFEKMRLKRWSLYRPYVALYCRETNEPSRVQIMLCYLMQHTINTYSLPTSWNSSQQEEDHQRELHCASNSESRNV